MEQIEDGIPPLFVAVVTGGQEYAVGNRPSQDFTGEGVALSAASRAHANRRECAAHQQRRQAGAPNFIHTEGPRRDSIAPLGSRDIAQRPGLRSRQKRSLLAQATRVRKKHVRPEAPVSSNKDSSRS